MRLALSVGHGSKRQGGRVIEDPGAVHPHIQVTEYATCSRIARVIEALFLDYRGADCLVVPVGVPPQDRVRYIQDQHRALGVDLAVELHLNGFASPEPDGTETLHYPGSREGKRYAEAMQEALVSVLGLPDRGVKEGWYRQDSERGVLYFLRATPCPALIVEPCFITNDESAAQIVNGARVQDIAWAVFCGVIANV